MSEPRVTSDRADLSDDQDRSAEDTAGEPPALPVPRSDSPTAARRRFMQLSKW